jgi:hypothetical protein
VRRFNGNAIVTQLVECNLAKIEAKGLEYSFAKKYFIWMNGRRFKGDGFVFVTQRYRGFESTLSFYFLNFNLQNNNF